MTMGHRAVFPLLLILGITVTVAMIPWYSGTSTSSAPAELSGESMHDFGEVDLAEGTLTLNRTFSLMNATRKTIQIREIRWSCGCLDATVDSDRVDPGQRVDVSAAIRIYSPGRHYEQVALVLDDETTHLLEFRAIARHGLRISSFPPQVRLVDGDVAKVTLLASDDRSTPARIVIRVADHVPFVLPVSFDIVHHTSLPTTHRGLGMSSCPPFCRLQCGYRL